MIITAVSKDGSGVIKEYKLDNEQIVNQEEAIQMVENKEIEGCNVFTTKDGGKAIRSNADGDPSNNLDNLPTF